MSTNFYDVSVGTYLQIVNATMGVMAKGAEHCAANGIDLADVVADRLVEDMADFHFQAVCVVHHSLGAIKGMQSGEFKPPTDYAQTDYAGLQALLSDAQAELSALSTEAVNGLADGRLVFKLGGQEIPFSNSNFLLSFSLPNLYFHATTLYDLLRKRGVPLGKMDFLGQLKIG